MAGVGSQRHKKKYCFVIDWNKLLYSVIKKNGLKEPVPVVGGMA